MCMTRKSSSPGMGPPILLDDGLGGWRTFFFSRWNIGNRAPGWQRNRVYREWGPSSYSTRYLLGFRPGSFLLGSLSIYLYHFIRSKPTELISLRNPPPAYSSMIPNAPVYDTHTFETYMSAVILNQLLLYYSNCLLLHIHIYNQLTCRRQSSISYCSIIPTACSCIYTYTTNLNVGGNLPSAIALLFQLSAPAYITDLRVSATLHELLLYDSNCSYVHIRLTRPRRSSTSYCSITIPTAPNIHDESQKGVLKLPLSPENSAYC